MLAASRKKIYPHKLFRHCLHNSICPERGCKVKIKLDTEKCYDAPCSKACPRTVAPDKKVRSLRFANVPCFARHAECEGCVAPCEKACLHPDFPLRIRSMLSEAAGLVAPTAGADISMEFCGVPCENPFFWVPRLLPAIMKCAPMLL